VLPKRDKTLFHQLLQHAQLWGLQILCGNNGKTEHSLSVATGWRGPGGWKKDEWAIKWRKMDQIFIHIYSSSHGWR
jgi:hypothetical protein